MLSGVLTTALYASGLLVFFTPLPVCLLVARKKFLHAGGTIVVAAALLAAIYLVLLPQLVTIAPQWAWVTRLLPLPGVGFVAVLGSHIGHYFALSYFLYYLVMGWVLGEGFARQWHGMRLIGTTSLAVACVTLLAIVGVEWSTSISVAQSLEAYLRHVVDQLVQLNTEADRERSQMALLQEYTPQLVQATLRIFPAFCWATGVFVSAINVACGRGLLRLYGIRLAIGGLTNLRAPLWMVRNSI